MTTPVSRPEAPLVWPTVSTLGFDGMIVSFADQLCEPANRAALAFRAAVDAAKLPGVLESSTSLVSTYLRFDPLICDHETLRAELAALISQQDWFAAPLPKGRRLWRVPTVYGGDAAHQLPEAAAAAGLSVEDAITSLSQARVRVQTVGFVAGLPYLGELPEAWDIPRQTELTAQVPTGGLCVAIRQLVLFPVATPTGWRQVGQTAIELFDPAGAEPFVLRPGDEVLFPSVRPEELAERAKAPFGGASSEPIL